MVPWFLTEPGAGCTHPAGPRCSQGYFSQPSVFGTIPGTAVFSLLANGGSVTRIRISSPLVKRSGKDFEEKREVLGLRAPLLPWHAEKKLGDLFLPLLAGKNICFLVQGVLQSAEKCGNCRSEVKPSSAAVLSCAVAAPSVSAQRPAPAPNAALVYS